MRVVTLCPSKDRVENAQALYASFKTTKVLADSELWFIVDHDDPKAAAYVEAVPTMVVKASGRRGMSDPLNTAASTFWDDADVLGFVGDDHRFRTKGWDRIIHEVLGREGGGLAYANDLAREDIPTQVFISAMIVKSLGWMSLPTAAHLYLDNTWRVLGDSADCLYYFKDIIIEHMHPTLGKAAWDANYLAVNDPAVYASDARAFEAWMANDAASDIAKVVALVR